MALLLANGSMSSGSGGEDEIRRALIESDLVECMVALPGQLFTNTQIPACIWFLTKSKKARGEYRDRSGQTLFIDARKLGYMINGVLRTLAADDLEKITGTFQKWKRSATDYADLPRLLQIGDPRGNRRPRLCPHPQPLRRRGRCRGRR